MKKFCVFMAILFAILTIILYVISIRDVDIGNSRFQVANIQSTVFAAAAAIACILNVIGAFVLTKMEELEYSIAKIQNNNVTHSSYVENHASDYRPSNSKSSLFNKSISDEEKPEVNRTWRCGKCGTINKESYTVCSGCGNGRY